MTREEELDWLYRLRSEIYVYMPKEWLIPMNNALDMVIKALEQEPRKGHCKDCQWWKDSDGAYRRGVRAESQCPINRKEVYEGNGYCYMFKPQESEE